ncbi:hypothetical protein M1466_00255 [Candidatus Dependentiae bacterium]|nr:hypothetical protein [Candidatus Dependentiae bacterium]
MKFFLFLTISYCSVIAMRDPFHCTTKPIERIPRVEGICTIQDKHYALVLFAEKTIAMQEGQSLDASWRIASISDDLVIFEQEEQRCHYPVTVKKP